MRAKKTELRKYGTTFSCNHKNANVMVASIRQVLQYNNTHPLQPNGAKLDHCDPFGVLLKYAHQHSLNRFALAMRSECVCSDNKLSSKNTLQKAHSKYCCSRFISLKSVKITPFIRFADFYILLYREYWAYYFIRVKHHRYDCHFKNFWFWKSILSSVKLYARCVNSDDLSSFKFVHLVGFVGYQFSFQLDALYICDSQYCVWRACGKWN